MPKNTWYHVYKWKSAPISDWRMFSPVHVCELIVALPTSEHIGTSSGMEHEDWRYWSFQHLSYSRICFGIIMLFAVLWAAMCSGGCYDAACIDCDFGNVFHVLLSTFHGATWGHLYPRWPFEQFLACAWLKMVSLVEKGCIKSACLKA